ncbi:MAG: VTT domain-containing protein [Candidatus Yonathbacteria bacterium]|nr:VTT domain-containing protein [Candidatus Yonathbacteria bacterium]
MHVGHALGLFIAFVEAHRFIGYAILFVGMLLEGETLLLGAGILVHLKAFDPLDTFFIALAGSFIGDFLWYYLGMFLHRRYGENKIIHYAKRNILRVFPNFERKPFWSIVVSKFIYGTNRSMLVLCGFSKIKLSLFARAEVLASPVWIMISLVLGYVLSYAALNITHRLKIFGIIVALAIVTFLAIEHLILVRARASAQKQSGSGTSQ